MATRASTRLIKIATGSARTRVPTLPTRGLRKARWTAAQPTSYCDSPTARFAGPRRGLVLPPRREMTHDVFTNQGRMTVSSTAMMSWEDSKPTSYAEPDDRQEGTAAAATPADEERSTAGNGGGVSAQLKHEYSVHAEPATRLSADALAEVVRAGGSPDAALFRVKVLEWVADGTISAREGGQLMDALGSRRDARRLGARAVLMRHGGAEAEAGAASDGDGVAGLTDEAAAGLSDADVRRLAAWSAGPAHARAAGSARAAEQRVLDAQEPPAAAPTEADGAEIPPMDRLLWGEPSVYPSAPSEDGAAKDRAGEGRTSGKREPDGGLNELLAIAAAPLAVGAVTILGSLLVGRPLR